MSAEQEQQVEAIFNSFDADKSGTIELSQLKAVAAALGEEIGEEEVKHIIGKLDANGDGKISLEEFKFWWVQGRKGKLGNLVYLKAKAMKMTQQFLDQFSRAGVSLKDFSKDKQMDLVDLSIGFGEPKEGGMELEASICVGGQRFKEQFHKLQQKITWLNKESINLVFVLPSEDPVKGKEELSALLSKLMDSNLVPFLTAEQSNPYLAIRLQPLAKCLVFTIQLKKSLAELLRAPIHQFDQAKSQFDEDFYILWTLSLKTNFSIGDLIDGGDLLQNLLKGFELRLSGEMPNSVIRKFREVVEATRKYDGSIQLLFSILLKNAFFKLRLRSPLMVERFFEKIGIKDILNECPSLGDILEQLALMPGLEEAKYNVESATHLIYQVLKSFKTNFDSEIQLYVQREDSLVSLRTTCPNAHKIFNLVFNEV